MSARNRIRRAVERRGWHLFHLEYVQPYPISRRVAAASPGFEWFGWWGIVTIHNGYNHDFIGGRNTDSLLDSVTRLQDFSLSAHERNGSTSP